jgi:hypothetical protein
MTSTYFEGQVAGDAKARRGYSRDRRPDCEQVNIGPVVSPEGGQPVGYEIFEGNCGVVAIGSQPGHLRFASIAPTWPPSRTWSGSWRRRMARRVWAIDRGMVSEENLDLLRGRGASYLVGTPKGQLRRFGQALLEEADWSEVRPGVEVKLVEHPDGRGGEQYIVARSKGRREKETAMLGQAKVRLLAKLHKIAASLEKRPGRPEAIERRIGRWQGKHSRAERYYQVEIRTGEVEVRPGGGDRPAKKEFRAVGLEITEKEVPLTWAERSAGAYLLRTNCTEKDHAKLWDWYIHLTQAGECFRISKSDLGLRPAFHEKAGRVEAHVLVCFLTLAIWWVLEMWMKGKGLGNCCRQLLKEISTIRMMDVVLPVRDAGGLNLRVVSRPDDRVAQLLARLGLELPSAPKIISDVVSKIEGGEG